MIIIDPFTEYLSGACKQYCLSRGIDVIELVSPYLRKAMGREVPASLQTPRMGKEKIWARKVGILPASDDETDIEKPMTCIFSESDAGLDVAERMQDKIGTVGNGFSPHLRNKYFANERAKAFGLKVRL